MLNKDERPQAIDMSLCLNDMCQNKCKRYYKYWKPAQIQSYIYSANVYDKNKKAAIRQTEWRIVWDRNMELTRSRFWRVWKR